MINFQNFEKGGQESPASPIFRGPLVDLTQSQQNMVNSWPTIKIVPVQDSLQQSLRDYSRLIEDVGKEQEEVETFDSLHGYIAKDILLEMEQGMDKGLNFATRSSFTTAAPERAPLEVPRVPPRFEPPANSRFFVIKSYNEADIKAAFAHSCWSSTKLGNRRLNNAFSDNHGKNIFLFFSVNGSGSFCAVAEMTGPVDFEKDAYCWSDPKWKGSFPVKFIFIKDISNRYLKNFSIPMIKNGVECNSSVITSRDTQELPIAVGKAMLSIFDSHKVYSSFFLSQ